jgi:predicted DNA-binding WGR domain protein
MPTIIVTRESLIHESGTKEYHLLLIENKETKNGVFISRWGKTDTFGACATQQGSSESLIKEYNNKHTEKTNRGYEHNIRRRSFTGLVVSGDETTVKRNLLNADAMSIEEMNRFGVHIASLCGSVGSTDILEPVDPSPEPKAPSKPLSEIYADDELFGSF